MFPRYIFSPKANLCLQHILGRHRENIEIISKHLLAQPTRSTLSYRWEGRVAAWLKKYMPEGYIKHSPQRGQVLLVIKRNCPPHQSVNGPVVHPPTLNLTISSAYTSPTLTLRLYSNVFTPDIFPNVQNNCRNCCPGPILPLPGTSIRGC